MTALNDQELVNPLREYSTLISTSDIRRLSENAERIVQSEQKGSLMSWFRPGYEDQLFQGINKLLTQSAELSIYGEIKYSNIQYDLEDGQRHWSEYFALAGRNFQKVLEIGEKYLPPIQQYQLTFMSSAELHNANQHASASVLAREARSILARVKSEQSIGDLMNSGLHDVLLTFFEGRFHQMKQIVDPYYTRGKRILEEITLPRSEVFDITCMLYIHRSLIHFSDFMISGLTSNIDSADKMLSKAREISSLTNRPDLIYFVNKLQISMRSLTQLSVWNLGKYFKLPDASNSSVNTFVAESLVRKNRFYLYPSQLQALQQGVLDSSNKHALIAMPTGSGKTLIAEFLILHALASTAEKSLVIFVAPSRALVHEKFDELSQSFKHLGINVCQITGEVSMESEERLPEFDIAVVTPEKFDMLLRKQFYGSKVVLLIVDEFHNIRIGFRGVRMQFGLLRFIEQFREARILLMSAVISNPDEVSQWAKANVSVRSLWRPTYVRYGKLSLEDDHTGQINFSDGIIRRIPFTMKLRGFRKTAAFLALQFSSEGPCMLFSHNRNNIFEYAKMLSTLIDIKQGPITSTTDPSSSENLTRLKRLIGDKEELYHWFAKGIGVHWGELPHEIRRLVEDGLRKGEIRVVVSTTTLAEGVNLPLKTIIVPAALVASIPMDLSTFFNLAGRAGRPTKEVEGQLVLMEPARS